MNFVRIKGYNMGSDIEVILSALDKEREQVHQQLMQIDRIIKRVRTGYIFVKITISETK